MSDLTAKEIILTAMDIEHRLNLLHTFWTDFRIRYGNKTIQEVVWGGDELDDSERELGEFIEKHKDIVSVTWVDDEEFTNCMCLVFNLCTKQVLFIPQRGNTFSINLSPQRAFNLQRLL